MYMLKGAPSFYRQIDISNVNPFFDFGLSKFQPSHHKSLIQPLNPACILSLDNLFEKSHRSQHSTLKLDKVREYKHSFTSVRNIVLIMP